MGRQRKKVRYEGSSASLTHPSAAAWQRKKIPCAGEVRTKERERQRAKKRQIGDREREKGGEGKMEG